MRDLREMRGTRSTRRTRETLEMREAGSVNPRMKRWFPILGWLPGYERAWLRPDFLAGLTVMALLVPEGMAYAELAGMPPQTAFYAAPIGLILYAVFGTSKQLVVAVSSAVAVMSASIVGEIAAPDTPEFIALTAALAVMVGVIAIVAGLLRLGRVAQFFSEAVMIGFVTGLALVIAIKQVPKLFGLEPTHGNFWARCLDLLQNMSETHLLTLAVGASSLLLMLALERWFHRVPAALLAMVYGIVVVELFNLDALGVHVVGDIPAGLAGPQLPNVSTGDLLLLIPGAIGLTLVVFAEAIGPARSFAGQHGYRLDANQELKALGASNFGAGLFQGFPIGASLSKSAANDAGGARSQMSGLIAAGATALVALFLTPLFRSLPEATLGAIVIVAVSGMVKVDGFRWLYRVNRRDFALAVIALLAVLTFAEVLYGLIVAVIISLVALIARASQSKFSVLGRVPGRIEFSDIGHHPENQEVPGLLIVRPDEEVFFANAAALRAQIHAMALSPERQLQAVLVDLEMTDDLDASSIHELSELKRDLETLNVRLMVSRVHPQVREVFDRSGLTDKLGAEYIFPRAIAAVVAHLGDDEGQEAVLFELARATLERMVTAIDSVAPHATGAERKSMDRLRQRVLDAIESIDEPSGDEP